MLTSDGIIVPDIAVTVLVRRGPNFLELIPYPRYPSERTALQKFLPVKIAFHADKRFQLPILQACKASREVALKFYSIRLPSLDRTQEIRLCPEDALHLINPSLLETSLRTKEKCATAIKPVLNQISTLAYVDEDEASILECSLYQYRHGSGLFRYLKGLKTFLVVSNRGRLSAEGSLEGYEETGESPFCESITIDTVENHIQKHNLKPGAPQLDLKVLVPRPSPRVTTGKCKACEEAMGKVVE